jgi:hypothetical protein
MSSWYSNAYTLHGATRCAHGALTLRMQIEDGVASLTLEGNSVTLQQYFKYFKDAGLKIIAPGQRSHTLLLGCSAQTTAALPVRCASAPSLRRAKTLCTLHSAATVCTRCCCLPHPPLQLLAVTHV